MAGRGNYYEQGRILDDPSVQAILNASDKVLPKDKRDALAFRPVGGATVIYGHYEGLQPKTEGILLGVVSPDGIPYSTFTRLRRNPRALQKEAQEVSGWAKGELSRMGYKLKETVPSLPSLALLRKIITTLAMRKEKP